MLIDRLRPTYSLSSMTCLLAIDKYKELRGLVAGAFAASKDRYGYRRIKAALKTGVSEKVIRDHGRRRPGGARPQAPALQFVRG